MSDAWRSACSSYRLLFQPGYPNVKHQRIPYAFANQTMKAPITKLLATILCGATLCGCISNEQTVYRDVERTKVEFENETAARIFYEALSKQPATNAKQESTTEVCIPVVFSHKRHVISGNNLIFNEAVKRCDTNQDGKITELEAKIFAEQRH
jgi:hypothetical protein